MAVISIPFSALLTDGDYGGQCFPRWPMGIMAVSSIPFTALLTDWDYGGQCFPFSALLTDRVMAVSASHFLPCWPMGLWRSVLPIFCPVDRWGLWRSVLPIFCPVDRWGLWRSLLPIFCPVDRWGLWRSVLSHFLLCWPMWTMAVSASLCLPVDLFSRNRAVCVSQAKVVVGKLVCCVVITNDICLRREATLLVGWSSSWRENISRSTRGSSFPGLSRVSFELPSRLAWPCATMFPDYRP